MTAADHTPNNATDRLREAVEALALRLSSRYARLCTIAQGDWDSMDEGELVEADILNRTLTEVRDILAAHPAPPSETCGWDGCDQPGSPRCSFHAVVDIDLDDAEETQP